MDFSKDFIYESYNKYYRIAETAKKDGDIARMKKALLRAAEYLKLLSELNEGDIAKEQLTRAKRMREIAESIQVPSTPISQSAHTPSQSQKSFSLPINTTTPILPDEVAPFLEFFVPGELKFGFEGVIGLEEAKEVVREYVINPRLYPKEYNYDFLQGAGVLLEGPPGTGKTTFAKALSKELNQPFALIKVSGLVNCYVGETSKNIDKLFEFLRQYAEQNRCEITVFFDEMDEIAQKRGSDDKTSQAAVPALLRNLGGVKENNGLLIIANTNCKDALDDALVDRFRRTIYIPLPDAISREKLLRLKLREVEKNYLKGIDFERVARETEGMNGRQITYLCDDFKHLISKSKVEGLEVENLTTQFLSLIGKRNKKD